MIKYLVVFLFMIFANNLQANVGLDYVRQNYDKAVEDETLTEKLLEYIKVNKLTTASGFAYRGALEALQAKHESNPFKKLEYVKISQATFEKAALAAPENIDVRIFRFMIESKMPSYLGYNKHITDDKNKIIALLEDEKTKLDTYQKNYLYHITKICKLSNTEKNIILKHSK